MTEVQRLEFKSRDDNPDHLDPELVLRWSNPHIHFEGGGLPLGSGDLIRTARELLND